MEEAELQVLIASATRRAEAMAELARECMTALSGLDQSVQEAEARFRSAADNAQQRLQVTLHELEQTEHQADFQIGRQTAALAPLQTQGAELERWLLQTASQWMAESEAATQRAEEAAAALERGVGICRQELDALQAAGRHELTLLQAENAALQQRFSDLRSWGADCTRELQAQLQAAEDNQQQLEGAFRVALDGLAVSYRRARGETEQRLSSLESRLVELVGHSERTLEQTLVSDLAQRLRSEAEHLGSALTGLETDIEELGLSLATLHQNFERDLDRSLIPGMQAVSSGLHQAAKAAALL